MSPAPGRSDRADLPGSCLLFFQAALLLGYLYAHLLSSRVPARVQWIVHAALLAAAAALLPLPIDIGTAAGADPRWWVLRTLAINLGLPFVAMSATAPLLQHWFSRSSDPRARDPYFLYAASNAGSLLGLFGNLALEPPTTRHVQVVGWTIGFWAVGALVAVCGYAARILPPPGGSDQVSLPPEGGRDYALWIVLALVPSMLLLGVTQHLATHVVSAPLLWVVPLALYLTTFIAAFSRKRFGSSERWGSAAAFAALLVLALSLAEVRYPVVPVTLAHLAAFTVLAMLCHTVLAERRPDAAHLTTYYLCISVGGVLGGAAAALVAPSLFSSILEYPIAIGAALFLRPQTAQGDGLVKSAPARMAWRAAAVTLMLAGYLAVSIFDVSATVEGEGTQRLVRLAFAVPAALLLASRRTAVAFAALTAGLLTAAVNVRTGGEVLARERTFFGVHQVSSVQNGAWHVLTHGTTTHGLQATRGRIHSLPTAYYHPSGPLGDVIFTLVPGGRFHDVAVVGLGGGALAAYAGSGVRMDFFEIDEAVIRIAGDPRYFTYLSDAKARPGVTVRTTAADGRLGISAAPAGSLDAIVIDAFSSDAIPTHLITREAMAIYESRLKPHGVIAFHVSSRFFDLPPVLARIAADRGLTGYVRHDDQVPPERAAEGMRASVWVVVARSDADFGQIAHASPRWVRLAPSPDVALWTDDYSNVLGAMH